MQRDWQQIGGLSELFRQQAESYWQSLPERPAAQCTDPSLGNDHLQEAGLGAEGALAHFERDLAPGLASPMGSRYWGFVTGGATPAAVLADWLVSATDQNPCTPADSIASAVEQQTIEWLLDLFDLPASFHGVFTTGATAANLLGILCGRQYAAGKLGVDAADQGMYGLDIEVFSAAPHASSVKCLGIAGLGRQFTRIACLEDSEAMDVAQLELALQRSRTKGRIVIASCGTVTRNDFDDLRAIAALCQKYDAWLHVDAAFGIFARLLEEKHELAAGLELADSITSDGHKWLNVPYDCGMFFTRHQPMLEDSLTVAAPYLAVESETPIFMNRGVENSRRFRALPVWFTLKAYGKAGHREIVRSNCELAVQLADWIEASADYELLAPCTLNTVLFRAISDGSLEQQNAFNKTRLVDINSTGKVFLTPGEWQSQAGFRAAFSSWQIESQDVTAVCEMLEEVACGMA